MIHIESNDPEHPLLLIDVHLHTGVLSAQEQNNLLPLEYYFTPGYPNPFNSKLTFQYGLPEAAPVKLMVYDVSGRQICTLIDEVKSAGHHTAIWSTESMVSGLYIVRMEMAGYNHAHKVTLIR